MAKPNKKGPDKTVNIYCNKCRSQLLKYRKGGKGSLIKCFVERIVDDYTLSPGICPNCGCMYARETLIRGVPALKIVGGKVTVK